MKKFRCSICGREVIDEHGSENFYGHNALPIMCSDIAEEQIKNFGLPRCCDECNWDVVLPVRHFILSYIERVNPNQEHD